MLSRTNGIFQVSALRRIFEKKEYPAYFYEYLVHGVVQGDAYKAVSFQMLCMHGLNDYLPGLRDWQGDCYNPTELGALSLDVALIDSHEINRLIRISQLYGHDFWLPFTVALIGLKKRSRNLLDRVPNPMLDELLGCLGGPSTIPDWSSSLSIVGGQIYSLLLQDYLQMHNLMRALYDRSHGKGTKRVSHGLLGLKNIVKLLTFSLG